MKKIILSLIAIVSVSVSFAQNVTAKNVPLNNNYIPKISGAQQITNSSFYEVTRGRLNSTKDSLTILGVFKAMPTSTLTTGASILGVSNTGNQLFRVNNSGAIYTGTLQGVTTSSFAAGSKTITVTNGIITNVQ